VVLIAVGLVSAQAYTRQYDLADIKPGQTVHVGGHAFTYEGTSKTQNDVRTDIRANVRIDGGQVYAPALQLYAASGQVIGTPSVRTGLRGDIYLTLERQPDADGTTTLTVRLVPLLVWLWVGGAIMAIGTVLAAFPGRRRRRPVDPVSASVPVPEERPLATVGAGDG
jgi:cytochrome c-type biogenesis protein CcmF